MPLPFRPNPCLLALGLAGALLTLPAAAADARKPRIEETSRTSRPPLNSAQLLAQMFLSEIALARGMLDDAAFGYSDLARQTNDTRIIRRANEIELARVMLHAQQKPEEAEAAIRKTLAQTPAAREKVLSQLPDIFSRNQDKNATVAIVRRLAEPYVQTAEAQYAIASVERDANHAAEAYAAARLAQSLKPDWEPAMLVLLETTPDARQAETADLLKAFCQRNPQAIDARVALARWLVQTRQTQEATDEARKLLATQPENPALSFAMVGVFVEAEAYADAEAQLQRLIDDNWGEADRLQLVLAQVQEAQGKTALALAGYDRIAVGTQFVAAQGRRARLLAATGQWPEARAALRNAAQRSPDDRARLLMQEALLLRQADRRAEALAVLDEVLAEQPDNIDALYDSALLAEQTGKPAELEKRLRKLLALDADHAHALNALAYSYVERNVRLGEAEKMLERAIQLEPEDPAILDSLGWLYFRQGKLPGAEELLRKAFALFPDPEVASHLIEVLWTAGKKDEARQQYREALSRHADDAVLNRTGKRLGL